MLTVRQIVHAIVVALFVAWISFGSWYSWYSSVPPTYKQAIEQSHDRTGNGGAKITPDERIANYTWWVAAFTFALAFVSAFQLFFLTRADKTARIAAEAASLNAKAALRAEQAHVYPIIEDESIVQMVKLWGRSGNSPDSTKDEIQGMGVSYRLKNYGKTPAIIRIAGHELVHAFRPPEDESKIVAFLEVDKILGPEESTETMVCSLHPQHPFSVADAMSVLRGKTTIWFHGFVTYDDLFGFERHLEFTWWYDGSLGRFGWYSFKGSEKPKEI
jgi:hypothetical protein